MAGEFPDHLLALPFADPPAAVDAVRRYAARRPLDAVVPVDDLTTVVAALIRAELGLRSIPVGAASATRNKLVMRERLAAAGVPSPRFASHAAGADPAPIATGAGYPCVLKPLGLSASRGVIRADTPSEFTAAFRRVAALLASPDGSRSARAPIGSWWRSSSRAGGGAGGTPRRRRAARAGAFRQAGSARRSVLRGDDLRDAVAPPRGGAGTVVDVTARAARGARPRARGRCTPSSASTRRAGRNSWRSRSRRAPSAGSARGRSRFGTGMSLEEIILRHALGLACLARA